MIAAVLLPLLLPLVVLGVRVVLRPHRSPYFLFEAAVFLTYAERAFLGECTLVDQMLPFTAINTYLLHWVTHGHERAVWLLLSLVGGILCQFSSLAVSAFLCVQYLHYLVYLLLLWPDRLLMWKVGTISLVTVIGTVLVALLHVPIEWFLVWEGVAFAAFLALCPSKRVPYPVDPSVAEAVRIPLTDEEGEEEEEIACV